MKKRLLEKNDVEFHFKNLWPQAEKEIQKGRQHTLYPVRVKPLFLVCSLVMCFRFVELRFFDTVIYNDSIFLFFFINYLMNSFHAGILYFITNTIEDDHIINQNSKIYLF